MTLTLDLSIHISGMPAHMLSMHRAHVTGTGCRTTRNLLMSLLRELLYYCHFRNTEMGIRKAVKFSQCLLNAPHLKALFLGFQNH